MQEAEEGVRVDFRDQGPPRDGRRNERAVIHSQGLGDLLGAGFRGICELESARDAHTPAMGGRVKRLAGHDSERVAIRYSRRAVLLALLFGLIAVLAMALFASLLTGSYEILALAPFSILFWLVVFVWVAARMSRAAGKRDGG